MRYIGSKRLLLEKIEGVIKDNIKTDVNIFCDIFSGTWSVAKYFKKDYTIISNDLLFLSYSMQRAVIMENVVPEFKKIKKYLWFNPINYFNDKKVELIDIKGTPFIYQNYSPNSKSERMYLSNDNALKIDYIRQSLDEWKQEELIEDNEYFYLLASLINAVPFYSNIAWTYWSYLKHWDKRALKPLLLNEIKIENNNKDNISYNEDANNLIKQISWDILYIDPPYNSRQYLPNYHLLETIAKYDSPEIYWKTWMRPYKNVRSKYCLKGDVLNEFEDLIKNANFKHIIFSYSTEWIMSENDITDILKKYGKSNTFKLYRIPYRRYKHKVSHKEHNLEELLFYIEKE